MLLVIFVVLLIALSAANGGNDVSKGVATLAGAGATNYRTAIIWGTVTTLAGCLVSLVIAGNMTKLFSTGIVTAKPTDGFAIAVLAATGLWVGLATWLKLPVSTTQALVGALVGAGVQLAPDAVEWGALPAKVVYPLIASIFVAYLLSVGLALLAGLFTRSRRSAPVSIPAGPAGTATETATEEAPRATPVESPAGRTITVAHWISSGATSFARGLNDTPKLVAVGSFVLVPAGMSTNGILLIVALSMAIGGLAVGMRVAKRLGEDVVRMSHTEGFRANLTTAILVGFGAQAGLPMSTTQVSAGAIAGSAGLAVDRIKFKTLRDFLIGWTITPAFTAAVAWGLGLLLI